MTKAEYQDYRNPPSLPQGVPEKTALLVAGVGEGLLLVIALPWLLLSESEALLEPTFMLSLLGLLALVPLLFINFFLFEFLIERKEFALYREFQEDIIFPLARNLRPRSILFLALASGIAEELFFRGLLDTQLSLLLGPLTGRALSALLFAYLHFAGFAKKYLRLILLYFFFGLYFSALAYHSASIFPGIVCHCLYNGLALLYVRYVQIPRRQGPKERTL